jgi:acyl-CoA thioester hydrolase
MKQSLDPALLHAANYKHHVQQDTQFGDMDALGHVNNLAVSRYYESARARWQLEFFGQTLYQTTNPTKIVLAEANTRFLDEIHFPETLQLTTGIRRIGNSSYVCSQALFRNEQCIGYCEAILVHTVNGKSAPISDDAKQKMQPYIVSNMGT